MNYSNSYMFKTRGVVIFVRSEILLPRRDMCTSFNVF